MAYKIMQKDEDGVLREVVIRGEAVRGSDFNPGDMELKQFDDETRSFTAVGSTGNPDRVEDIIDQNGWVLDNFEKNPVGMWAHNYSMLPIFMISDVEIKPRAKKLLFRANFDDYEFADNVYNSYKKKFMRAFSVGFLPLKYSERDRDEMSDEERQRAGWWGGMYFEKQELLEISAVPIPMHPEALADIKSMGLPTEFGYGEGFLNLTTGRSILSDGRIWIPIDDVNAFTDMSSSISLEGGIKVVSGKPVGGRDSVIIDAVVGYIFPKGMNDKQMIEWLVNNAISEERATALVSIDLGKYLELKIEDDGKFGLYSIDGSETTDSSVVDDNDIVNNDLDKKEDGSDILPEGVSIEGNGLLVVTNLGSFTIGSDILEKAGLAIREGELVDVRNRDSLDNAVNTLLALLGDVKIENEPEPAPVEEQKTEDDEGDFALLLTVAEELQAEGRELIDVDPEILKSVVNEVLREGIGGLVKSSLTESLKHVTGNVE